MYILGILLRKLESLEDGIQPILLNLRNTIASIFGLKTGKIKNVYENLAKLNFKQDQSIRDFFIFLKGKNHLIAELKDKHLDSRFSILIRQEVFYYDDVVDNNDPNALLTGFQFGVSYTIRKINFSIKINRNSSFGDIQNIGNNQNITLQFQLGYVFKKRQKTKN